MTKSGARRAKNTVILALGGNIGDVKSTFENLYKDFENHNITVVAKAPLYKSKSLLRDGQDDYINTVCIIYTCLEPLPLLGTLKKLEYKYGRVKTEQWQARPLDIDIIDYNNTVFEGAHLKIPHSEMEHRPFVVLPLADIAPRYISPKSGRTVHEMINKLTDNLDIEKI